MRRCVVSLWALGPSSGSRVRVRGHPESGRRVHGPDPERAFAPEARRFGDHGMDAPRWSGPRDCRLGTPAKRRLALRSSLPALPPMQEAGGSALRASCGRSARLPAMLGAHLRVSAVADLRARQESALRCGWSTGVRLHPAGAREAGGGIREALRLTSGSVGADGLPVSSTASAPGSRLRAAPPSCGSTTMKGRPEKSSRPKEAESFAGSAFGLTRGPRRTLPDSGSSHSPASG